MFFLFFLFWLVLNGRLTLEIALFGVAISVAMYIFICAYDGFSFDRDYAFVRRIAVTCGYIVHMIGEIIMANLNVIRLVLSPKYEAEPCLIRFKTELTSPEVQVLLADSITITPGTITASLENGVFIVHCLDTDFSDIQGNAKLMKLLKKLESGITEEGRAK